MRKEMMRFLAALSVADDCWEWGSSKNARGYGRFGDGNGGWVIASRKAYELFVGDIPDGLCVLHSCDNPACVNPRHLFLGTHADNMADMRVKGRASSKPGSKNPNSKLTEQQVRAIVSSPKLSPELAKEFGVTVQRINQIRRGLGWRHLGLVG
jgi:hypothetical protein